MRSSQYTIAEDDKALTQAGDRLEEMNRCWARPVILRKKKVFCICSTIGISMLSIQSADSSYAAEPSAPAPLPHELTLAKVYPVKRAVAGAVAMIVAHNHPSGDPAPSLQDINVTRKLREAARLLEIELLDHVIVGESKADPASVGYYSFRSAGLL